MPTHTHSITHGQMPGSRYSRRLHRESWALRVTVAVSKAPGRACGRGGMGRRGRRTRRRLRLENAVTRIAGERASTRRQTSATYIYIKDPGGSMGGPCGFRIPMTRPVCARGAPKRRPSMHGANSQLPSEMKYGNERETFITDENTVMMAVNPRMPPTQVTVLNGSGVLA